MSGFSARQRRMAKQTFNERGSGVTAPAAASAVRRKLGSPGLVLFSGTPTGRHVGLPALDRLRPGSGHTRIVASVEADRQPPRNYITLFLVASSRF